MANVRSLKITAARPAPADGSGPLVFAGPADSGTLVAGGYADDEFLTYAPDEPEEVATARAARVPFSLVPAEGPEIRGPAEVWRARDDPRAFIVCVFPSVDARWPRASIRFAYKAGAPIAHMESMARPGVCPHPIGPLDPPARAAVAGEGSPA